MELALKVAADLATDVDINAHGTAPRWATRPGQAIKSVFDAYKIRQRLQLKTGRATRSAWQHRNGPVGAGLEPRGLAPTINYETPDPDCDLDYTPRRPRERKINIVMSESNFGFGGHNVARRRLVPQWSSTPRAANKTSRRTSARSDQPRCRAFACSARDLRQHRYCLRRLSCLYSSPQAAPVVSNAMTQSANAWLGVTGTPMTGNPAPRPPAGPGNGGNRPATVRQGG